MLEGQLNQGLILQLSWVPLLTIIVHSFLSIHHRRLENHPRMQMGSVYSCWLLRTQVTNTSFISNKNYKVHSSYNQRKKLGFQIQKDSNFTWRKELLHFFKLNPNSITCTYMIIPLDANLKYII